MDFEEQATESSGPERLLNQASLIGEEIIANDRVDRRTEEDVGKKEEEDLMARLFTQIPDRLDLATTPCASPLGDVSAYTRNGKRIEQMLLDDQQKFHSRDNEWAPRDVDPISPRSLIDGMELQSLQDGPNDSIDDSLQEIGFAIPSTEELAERYSNQLVEKDLHILAKDRRIAALERTKRELENSLEECQKELKQKTETSTSSMGNLKKIIEEKDKCIMATSDRLRKVTESYNSSEKRWKEQQCFLEEQIDKLKTSRQSHIKEDRERLSEQFLQEKELLDQALEEAKEENILQKQKFSTLKSLMESEIYDLRHQKVSLEAKFRVDIKILQDKLMVSEHTVETALHEQESCRAEFLLQDERNRKLAEEIVNLRANEEVARRQEHEKEHLEKLVSELKEKLEENENNHDTFLCQHYQAYEDLQKANQVLKEELEEQRKELELKAHELRRLEISTAELKLQLDFKTEELSTAAEKNKGIEDKLKKAMKALKQKNEKINELKNRLDEDAMNTSSPPCTETRLSLDDHNAETKDLQMQITQLNDQREANDAAISVMERQLKESKEALETAVKNTQDQLEENVKLLEETEHSLFVKNEECVRMEERLAEAEQTYRMKIEEQLKLLQQHEAYETSITAELDQLRAVEAQLREVVNQHQEHYNNLYYHYSQGSQEYVNLSEAKKEIEVTLEILQKDNDQLSENVVALKDKLDQATKELQGRDSLHAAQIENMQEECQRLSESAQIGQADVAYKEQQLKNLETIVAEYENKLQVSAMAQEDLGHKVEELKEQLGRFQTELELARDIHATCDEKYSTLLLEAEVVEGKLADSNNELNQCRAQLQEFNDLRINLPEYLKRVDALLQVLNNKQAGDTVNASRLVDALNSASILGTTYILDADNLPTQFGILPTKNEVMEHISSLANILQHELHLSTETAKVRSLQSQVKDLQVQLEMAGDPQENHILKAQVVSLSKALQSAPDAQQFAMLQTQVQQLKNQLDAAIDPESIKLLERDLEEKKKEVGDLRFELEEGIIQEKRLKESLESRENETKVLRNELLKKEEQINELRTQASPVPEVAPSVQDFETVTLEELTDEKELAYQRKIDLLHTKLQEVEESEIRCYEDYSKSKIHRTELEMDNLRMSAELEQIRKSIQNGDNDPRNRAMENQLVLMTKTLDDRDNLCKELLKNVQDLQADLDALQIRMNTLSNPPSLELPAESLSAKCMHKDCEIFSLQTDLRRERKIRELYEGQLFLATSKKQFESSTKKATATGSWFGFGDLFTSSQPSRPLPPPSPSSRSHSNSISVAPQSPSRPSPISCSGTNTPVTPLSPAGLGRQHSVSQLSLSPNPPVAASSEG